MVKELGPGRTTLLATFLPHSHPMGEFGFSKGIFPLMTTFVGYETM